MVNICAKYFVAITEVNVFIIIIIYYISLKLVVTKPEISVNHKYDFVESL
jgi:hypothetical protein